MSRQYRHVVMLAAVSLLVAAAAGAMRFLVSPAIAPRINVRWAPGVSDEARAGAERTLHLLDGELREGRTWAYDLGDISRANVRALVAHPAVEDTHYIDRGDGTVWRQAPAGHAAVGGAINRIRDSAALLWAGTIGGITALVAGVWLATNRRTARPQTIPR